MNETQPGSPIEGTKPQPKSDAEIAEAKEREKQEEHAHSHHVAGTQHPPETREEREQNAPLSE